MDVVRGLSPLLLAVVVMATAMNMRSASGGEAEVTRLLAREEMGDDLGGIEDRSDCPVSWRKESSTRSMGGQKSPDTDSVARCLQRCAADKKCFGVDVDTRKDPVFGCWEHFRDYDFDKHRTYRAYGFNQYFKENC